MFKLIPGKQSLTSSSASVEPKPSPDYSTIYMNAYFDALDAYSEDGDPASKAALLSRLIFNGVRFMNVIAETEPFEEENTAIRFAMYQSIIAYVKRITPDQLTKIFPITKIYDGERYGMKDFFFTQDALEQYGMDKALGEQALSILLDYVNRDVGRFVVGLMQTMDAIRRADGEKGMIEEFFGFADYMLRKDPETGKEYLHDPETGETFPVKKQRPRYARLVT